MPVIFIVQRAHWRILHRSSHTRLARALPRSDAFRIFVRLGGPIFAAAERFALKISLIPAVNANEPIPFFDPPPCLCPL